MVSGHVLPISDAPPPAKATSILFKPFNLKLVLLHESSQSINSIEDRSKVERFGSPGSKSSTNNMESVIFQLMGHENPRNSILKFQFDRRNCLKSKTCSISNQAKCDHMKSEAENQRSNRKSFVQSNETEFNVNENRSITKQRNSQCHFSCSSLIEKLK